jgi:hypothetical protein
MYRRLLLIASLFTLLHHLGFAQAQDVLRVKHNEDNKVIVMRFLPRNEALTGKEFTRVEIPPGEPKQIQLIGEDPWFVNCYLKGERTVDVQISSQVINLRQLAAQGGAQPHELQLSFAESLVNGQRRFQTMSGMLLDPSGDPYDLFALRQGNDESLAEYVLRRQWDTEFAAINGGTGTAVIDFRSQTFKTPDFVGRFNAVAVVQEETMCHVYGKWMTHDGQTTGDFIFTVTENARDSLKGLYSVSGKREVFRWVSR